MNARSKISLAALSVTLLVLAVLLLGFGLGGQHHAPSPPASAALGQSSSIVQVPTASIPAKSSAHTSKSPVKTAFHVDIPAINVHSDLLSLGLNPDQTIEVPPLDRVSEAGWYRYAPLPGAVGPAIILGHIDSAEYGRGVFFNLGDLRPGDSISVSRPDHRVASFTVNRVLEVAKNNFPTQAIYGNTANAQLRLITCGGRFDTSTRSYLDNIVVFATLTTLTAA